MTLLFRSKSSRLALGETEEEEEEDEKYDPVSTRMMNPMVRKEEEEREKGGGQFPIVAFVAAALRKSLLVSCSVERDETTSLDISFPTNVKHVCHVTFDRFNGFLGLPVEFQPDLPRKVPSASASVFGVSPESMQCSIDDRGNSVPTILLLMQQHLYQGGGLQAEGIFRINPENTQEEFARKQLNNGVIPQGMDVHCLAGLIKAWFRELPKGVLDSLTPEQVMHCNSEEECTYLVQQLPHTEGALLDWAVNLMADIAHNEHHNKMNARNIAMVFAPNMTQMADPLTALIHAVQVMNFLKTLIVGTLRLRDEPDTKSTKTDNLEASISTRDSRKQPHGTKLQRSITLDRSELSPEKKHRKIQEKYSRNVTMPTMSAVSDSSSEPESGILDRLNLRKGVRKLYKHPIFQFGKPVRKTTELGGCK